MTYPTSQKIADALSAETCAPEHEERRQTMARYALADHYHEYVGHTEGPPLLQLADDCRAIGLDALADRVMAGEFEATAEEAVTFSRSLEGLALAVSDADDVETSDKLNALGKVVDLMLNGKVTEPGDEPVFGFSLVVVKALETRRNSSVRIASNIARPGVLKAFKALVAMLEDDQARKAANEAADAAAETLADVQAQGNA